MTALIVSMWAKRRVSADQILGRRRRGADKSWAARAHLFFTGMLKRESK